ncbi:unnamed protein product [Closterium sp. NIES-54]
MPPDPDIEAAALGASESALPSLHLPSFSTNLVSAGALQDAMVTTITPGGQRVLICTCTRTGRHLATFTRRPGSSLYTLTTKPPQVSASLPPLPPSPAPPCLPSVEGRQSAAPHSSSFPPTTAPLQTLHMDVWGPARVSGQDRERYFLLVVDDYTRYTTVFPLCSKGEVADVLIPWIRAVRLQLRERFREDLPVLRLHSDRVGKFSSDLLQDFCRGEGILQSFMLPASPQQNGVAERRIGLVMEVARTSIIHAVAPHFLWPFAVWYAAHQLNLWPCVSLLENSPTLRWTGKVGDASVFRVDPLPLGVPVEVVVDSGAARGAVSGGAASGGAEPASAESGGAEPEGAEPGGAQPEGVEPGGAESEGAESGGAEPRGSASAGGLVAASPRQSHRREPLSPQQLREWFAQCTRLRSGTGGAGGPAAGDIGAGATGGAGAACLGGACTRGTRAAGAGGFGGAGAEDPGGGGAGAGGPGAGDPGAEGIGYGDPRARGAGAGVGGLGAEGPGAEGAGAGDPRARGAGAGGAGAGGTGAGGTVQR